MNKYDFLFEIDDLFTQEECNQLIKKAEDLGMTEVDRGNALYDRSIMFDRPLADKLFQRVKHLLPTYFGSEKIVCMNDCFRFSKYNPGGRFEVHRDGINIDKQGNRAIMTLNIFLNVPEEGGGTMFYGVGNDGRYILRKNVRPKPGRGALFYNQIPHEGEIVKKGLKYLIRTDVMASTVF